MDIVQQADEARTILAKIPDTSDFDLDEIERGLVAAQRVGWSVEGSTYDSDEPVALATIEAVRTLTSAVIAAYPVLQGKELDLIEHVVDTAAADSTLSRMSLLRGRSMRAGGTLHRALAAAIRSHDRGEAS